MENACQKRLGIAETRGKARSKGDWLATGLLLEGQEPGRQSAFQPLARGTITSSPVAVNLRNAVTLSYSAPHDVVAPNNKVIFVAIP